MLRLWEQRTEKYVPEGAQQPVIDDLEEACHGNGSLICSETTETMALASLAACLAVQSLRIIPGGSLVARTLVEFDKDGLEKGPAGGGDLAVVVVVAVGVKDFQVVAMSTVETRDTRLEQRQSDNQYGFESNNVYNNGFLLWDLHMRSSALGPQFGEPLLFGVQVTKA